MKNYAAAAMAFERVLQLNPRNGRAKLELGYAYFYSDRGKEAKRLFEEVLASSPGEKTSDQINKFLDILAKGDSRLTVSGRADIAFFLDDNVNIGPKSDVIDITPIIFGTAIVDQMQLGEESAPEDDEGFSTYLSVVSVYDVGDRQGWAIGGDGSFFKNWLNERPDRENVFYRVSSGFAHAGQSSMFRIPLSFAHIISDDDPLVDIWAVEPGFRKLIDLNNKSFLSTSGSFELREYDELSTRDGYFVSLAESYERNLTEKTGISMGLRAGHDHTDQKFYEYTSLEASLGVKMILREGIIAYARGSYGGSKYSKREPIAPEKREDDWIKGIIGVSFPVKGSLRLDVNHNLTYNDSTFDIYEYDRSVTTVTASVAF